MENFKTWLKNIEEAMTPILPGKITPAQQQAQDLTTDALSKMPLKPGEKISNVLADPKNQMNIIKNAGQLAKQQGKSLNLGAAADVLDKDKI